MKAKMIEIRDAGTFIPAVAFYVDAAESSEAESYLLSRVGMRHRPFVGMTNSLSHMSAATFEANEWPPNPRTYRMAHKVLEQMVDLHGWDNLPDGVVVDVEFELGETTSRKVSERLGRKGGPF